LELERWYVHVLSALGKLGQEDLKLMSLRPLGNIVKPHLKINSKIFKTFFGRHNHFVLRSKLEMILDLRGKIRINKDKRTVLSFYVI
jgi:hypothetical protein